MPRDGGNGGSKSKIINTLKYDNLVLVFISGRSWPYIGLKFGREMRHPFVFCFGKDFADPSLPPPAPGVIPFALLPIPFCDDDKVFLDCGYFWHTITNEEVQATFRRLISPIIQI